MKNFYQQLVEEKGETAAKEYMREIRKRVTKHPGGSFRDKTVAKAASMKAHAEAKKDMRDLRDKVGD